jgi:hypothetical protein
MKKEYKEFPDIKLVLLARKTSKSVFVKILKQSESLRRKEGADALSLCDSNLDIGNGLYPIQMSIKSREAPEFFRSGAIVVFYIRGSCKTADYATCAYRYAGGRSLNKFMRILREMVSKLNKNTDVDVKVLI